MTVSFRLVKSLRQILFLAIFLNGGCAVADQTVYKCGQEITNQPVDPSQCQKLLISTPTQIEGTRVQNGQSPKLEKLVSDTVAVGISSAPSVVQEMHQRNAQARTILEDEWQKLSTRHAEMVRIFNGGQPALQEGESFQSPPYQRRVSEMQAQIERMSRDLMALKRELTRHPSNLASVQTK